MSPANSNGGITWMAPIPSSRGSAAAGAPRRTCRPGRPWREGPDVQLVDDQVVPRRLANGVVAPVERVRVVDDGVADRVGDLAGVRIDPRQVAVGRPDREAILGARGHSRDIGRPGLGRPVIVSGEGGRVAGPVVECARHEDGGRVWRPDPERGAVGVGDGAHAGASRRSRDVHARDHTENEGREETGPR